MHRVGVLEFGRWRWTIERWSRILFLRHLLHHHEDSVRRRRKQALDYKHAMMEKNKGKYVLGDRGRNATKDGGIYRKVAGRPEVDDSRGAEGAAAVIAIGSCASWRHPIGRPEPDGRGRHADR